LDDLSPGVIFNNNGRVRIETLKHLSPGVEFNNNGFIDLRDIDTISPGVKFNNKGEIRLKGVWTDLWEGNIENIDSKRLWNLMIKKGLFV
jgi:hypothetical protein